MNAILEAAQEEETRLEAEFTDARNHYETRIEAVRQLMRAYGGVEPAPEPKGVSPEEVPVKEAYGRIEKAAKKLTRKAPAAKVNSGLPKLILDALGKHYPKPVGINVILAATHPADAKAVRTVLAQLVENGEVVKEGKARGTKYTVAGGDNPVEANPVKETKDPPPESDAFAQAAADDRTVLKFLGNQSHPQSVSLVSVKTGIPTQRTHAAMVRLMDKRMVHKVRIGAGDAFEVVS